MGILDVLLRIAKDRPDDTELAKMIERARVREAPPSTAANRSFRAQTPEGEAHLDAIFRDAQYADLPQYAYDQSYGDMLFHHVGKPDLESYDLGAARKANEQAPVGLYSYPEKSESDTYLRNRLKDYPDVPAGQTSFVTSAKNAFVVGADKPTEAMRNSFINALERRNGWKYDELLPSQKGYVDSKVNHFMATGLPTYGQIPAEDMSKIYTDNGVDMLVSGREVIHLRPQQARKPDAMFDPMMKGENNLNAFTGGKPDISGGLMSAISSGASYMPSDDTDYGEDATSAYADIPEQIWNNMSMLDKAALVTSPIPFVGAGTGILADLANMYNNPEERTGLNAALLAANVIPGAKIADAAGGILGSVRKMADDYRGAHTAPMRDSGAPAHELAGDIYPEDFYSPEGFNYYANFGGTADRESYNIARSLRGNPDADVTIYRAVPKGTKGINKGDWVAVSKKYAKEHGESALGGDYEIISKKVKAKDIYTNGDSINEWGYDPSKAK